MKTSLLKGTPSVGVFIMVVESAVSMLLQILLVLDEVHPVLKIRVEMW